MIVDVLSNDRNYTNTVGGNDGNNKARKTAVGSSIGDEV